MNQTMENQHADKPASEPPLVPVDSCQDSDAKAPALSVVSCNQPERLEQYFEVWQDLADHALEKNVFYRPWMLLPAIWEFGADKPWTVLFLVDDNASASDPPKLYGMIPLEYDRRFKKMPVGVYRMWHHSHCFLHTPLIRAGHADACFRAIHRWFQKSQPRAGLWELNRIRGDGPFYEALQTWAATAGIVPYEDECYERALLVPDTDADTYLKSTLSTSNMKELRRQRRRLGETGKLDLVVLQDGEDLQPWLDEFCQLEAAGWKGEHGTAFASHTKELDYFQDITRAAYKHGALMMMKLVLDGTPIAAKCNFVCTDGGSYAFKIAYDEQYHKFSPGVQLEVDNIRQVHERPHLQWMDSCAEPQHFMINRLWGQRRTIRSLLLPTSGLTGRMLLKFIPTARWFRQKLHQLKSKRLSR